jgi:catechol-2,3-dioxygenase
MNLGKFSLSLAVKDIDKSLDFYKKLGFEVIDGGHMNSDFPDSDDAKWRIMKNESATIGLFQGMFESNILTFNPSDSLQLQQKLKDSGVSFTKEASENDLSAILSDPDGNMIMFDQI